MNKRHFRTLLLNIEANEGNKKRIRFIDSCVHRGIHLDYIDVNDWSCNLKPSVYIHNRKNLFAMRRYFRCADSDVSKAVLFHKN